MTIKELEKENYELRKKLNRINKLSKVDFDLVGLFCTHYRAKEVDSVLDKIFAISKIERKEYDKQNNKKNTCKNTCKNNNKTGKKNTCKNNNKKANTKRS